VLGQLARNGSRTARRPAGRGAQDSGPALVRRSRARGAGEVPAGALGVVMASSRNSSSTDVAPTRLAGSPAPVVDPACRAAKCRPAKVPALPDLLGYAGQPGLDASRFRTRPDSRAGAARVAEDTDSAGLGGGTGTPTFFVNGRHHYGRYDIAELTVAVRAATLITRT
jgi:hypothetical protein